MKIINLIEDTAGADGCLYEHGLSFYIETENHKLLLDTGASDAFIKNAEKKAVDLSAVDIVVISHGHYDHTGGLIDLVKINPNAKIYINKNAVGEFYNLKYAEPKYIGMDKRISQLSQVIFLDGDCAINDEISIFTGARGRRLWPKSNETLKEKCGGGFVQDEFVHEQYLVVREGEKNVLLSGCAHNGILNIIDRYREIYCGDPTHMISGFHTSKPEYTEDDDELIRAIAHELSAMDTAFYSGHCSGEHALRLMKDIMKDKLRVVHSGEDII